MKSISLNLIAIIVLLSTCTTKVGNDANVFRINQATGIESLDPAFAKSLWMMWHANHLFNRLVVNDSNLNIQPSLAKSWTISADRKTYIFHLRTDAFFQDNDALPMAKAD
jgi:oligopeptide transport system substrate-binding protein